MYCPTCRQSVHCYCSHCGKDIPKTEVKKYRKPICPLYEALVKKSMVVTVSSGVARRMVLLDDVEEILSMMEQK